jgi:hypothetical protein
MQNISGAGGAGNLFPTSLTLASSIALRVRHLLALGERPLYEVLCEIVGGADPLSRLEAYGALDPDTVRALGADRLPFLFLIEGGRR